MYLMLYVSLAICLVSGLGAIVSFIFMAACAAAEDAAPWWFENVIFPGCGVAFVVSLVAAIMLGFDWLYDSGWL